MKEGRAATSARICPQPAVGNRPPLDRSPNRVCGYEQGPQTQIGKSICCPTRSSPSASSEDRVTPSSRIPFSTGEERLQQLVYELLEHGPRIDRYPEAPAAGDLLEVGVLGLACRGPSPDRRALAVGPDLGD